MVMQLRQKLSKIIKEPLEAVHEPPTLSNPRDGGPFHVDLSEVVNLGLSGQKCCAHSR